MLKYSFAPHEQAQVQEQRSTLDKIVRQRMEEARAQMLHDKTPMTSLKLIEMAGLDVFDFMLHSHGSFENYRMLEMHDFDLQLQDPPQLCTAQHQSPALACQQKPRHCRQTHQENKREPIPPNNSLPSCVSSNKSSSVLQLRPYEALFFPFPPQAPDSCSNCTSKPKQVFRDITCARPFNDISNRCDRGNVSSVF